MKKSTGIFVLLALCTILILPGCSNSDSDSSSAASTTISGTASAGAPVVGTITVKDADGTVFGPADIEADGSFTVDVSGGTAPFVIKATASAYALYSYASASGQANVNPLTSLIVAAAAGVDDPGSVYDDGTEIAETAVSSALADVQTVLASLFEAFGVDTDFDPLTDDCTVNHVGIDALFDSVSIEINTGTGAVEVKASDDTVLVSTTTTTISEATPVSSSGATDAASQVTWAGTYNYCELFMKVLPSNSNCKSAAGTMNLNADGTWTAHTEVSSESEDLEDPDINGTYSIDATGKILIHGTQYGVVTPDGEVIMVAADETSEDDKVGVLMMCKRDTTLTNASLNGQYLCVDIYRDSVSDGAGASVSINAPITFDGSGGYTLDEESGTYSVDGNGRITIDGTRDYGMIAMDGDVIVLPDYNPAEGDDIGMSVLVKISTEAGWGLSSIDGDYNFGQMFAKATVDQNSSDDTARIARGEISFDGAGNYSYSSTYASTDEDADESFTGTYTAETTHEGLSLNHMVMSVEEESLPGIFSPNGYLVIVPQENSENNEEAGFTLGMQAW